MDAAKHFELLRASVEDEEPPVRPFRAWTLGSMGTGKPPDHAASPPNHPARTRLGVVEWSPQADGSGAERAVRWCGAAVRCGAQRDDRRLLDRYDAAGLAGLLADWPRAGRPERITANDEAAIIARTLHTAPPSGTHWSKRWIVRSLACR